MIVMTNEQIEASHAETERLSHELNIANADHVALWLETNMPGASLAWLACRIVDAHEAAHSPKTEAAEGEVDPDAATGCADDFLPGSADQWREAIAQPPAEVQQGVAGDIRREIMDRTRNMMGMLADLREAVDLDDESASEVLGYCDDLETAVHNIGAVASHLATPQQGQEVEG